MGLSGKPGHFKRGHVHVPTAENDKASGRGYFLSIRGTAEWDGLLFHGGRILLWLRKKNTETAVPWLARWEWEAAEKSRKGCW